MSIVTESMGIGIIGYGGFGQFLHRSWAAMHSVEVRAVADVNPALRAAASEITPGWAGSDVTMPEGLSPRRSGASSDVTFYEDWREMLADGDIHIVSIATPPITHADMACEAMRAGKHVLIEKPLATTREDARRIRTVAEETRRIAAVDYMLRFNPIVETLQAWARDGPFGKLRRVIVENYAQDESLAAEHWFWDSEKSGGILVEHAVHFIDVVDGCTVAVPASVEGLAVRRDDGRTDRMGLTVVFADGLVTQQYHAFSRPGFFEDTSMRFVFDLAQIDVEGWIPLGGRITALSNAGTIGVLERLPGFQAQKRTSLGDAFDASRPEGWGSARSGNTSDVDDAEDAGGTAREQGFGSPTKKNVRSAEEHGESSRNSVRSGGLSYDVTEQIWGSFALPLSKTNAYAEALRSTIADVAVGVRDPDHRLRAGLDEGLRSLDIAITASERAIKAAERSSRST